MDDQRFDDWTKTLLTAGSRRAALRLLAGTALGVGFARLGVRPAAAACGSAGNKCCTGKCNAGAVCNPQGYCKCEKGRRNCGGDCIKKKRCCPSDPVPLCNVCQRISCRNGNYRCVGTGQVCGRECCQPPEACCLQTDGTQGCFKPNATCGPCKGPCGDKCCFLWQGCCRAADYSYHCISRGSGC